MLHSGRAVAVAAVLTGIVFGLPWSLDAQTFQGPAQGTSAVGLLTDTNTFPAAAGLRSPFVAPEGEFGPLPVATEVIPPLAPLGSNEQDDPAAFFGAIPGAAAPGLVTNFVGLPDLGTVIPPDPITAAGPNHLMALVNQRFAIFSKTGSNQKEIDAPTWFNNVLPGNNAFDPKVIYDHFADRWVMVYLQVDFGAMTSNLLVSASDDSDPHGLWCNWVLPGNQNGSTVVSNWSDYQGLGFDQDAVYIVPNQFGFSPTSFAYAKIRILPKATLYDPACPAITWTDFWDLRDPTNGFVVSTVRPAVTFGVPGVEYLINESPQIPRNIFTLWSLTNPLDPIPTLTAVNVPITQYNPPPNADQLGGSTIPIEVGGERVRNLVYRNGSVWTAHSVANVSGQFARARYVRIDVSGPTVLEDVAFGNDDCWLYYPAITADQNDNMVMVYNQSCTTEFIGIRYTGRTPSDVALQPSAELKAGEANYVKDFGSDRNRWGDYNGIAVDPADPRRVWMFAEYAASPANTWGTWFGEVSPRRIGDVNNDGNVDVGDIVLLVEFILEISIPSPLDVVAADCTQDAVLDIGDVVCVVNLILGATGPVFAVAPPAAAPGGGLVRARLNASGVDPVSGRRTILLEAELGPGVAGLQARIGYDAARVRLGEPELAPRAAGFELASHRDGDELVILLYDLGGATLDPGEGSLVRLPIETYGAVDAHRSGLSLELKELLLADKIGVVRRAEVAQTALTPLPLEFRLSRPYPNPVLNGTKLDLEIPEGIRPELSGAGGGRADGAVRVVAEVFNVRGQRVRLVTDEDMLPGRHSIAWDGRNDRGGLVGAGLYVLRLRAGPFSATRKLIVANR